VTGVLAELAQALRPEFEVLRPLGEGSTASVFLAREPALRRLVAVKVPHAPLAEDRLVRQRFEREAQAAARIRHPSVATVHRIGRLPDGTPFLVLEYVTGRTLEDVLRAEGPLAPGDAVEVLSQVAAALEEAHSQGVVHRDLRPRNIFWSGPGHGAVLTDFGLAGILETGAEVVTRLTRPGESLGSPAYRTPEQLLGEPATPAADIYALGVLGYELLTGELPFLAESPSALAHAHLHQPPRLLQEMLPSAPPVLAGLLFRCLSKDPHHRPDAAGVRRCLEAMTQAADAEAADPLASALGRFPAVAAFLAELRQRRVYNVALAYTVMAFLLLQGAELVLPYLPLPDWTYTVAVALTLAGFPVAVMLAWMYDLTSAGIRRAGVPQAGGPRYLRWLLPAIAVGISLALAAVIGWWVLSGARSR
jgi:eukaryotic-like serine/threonine-protein kinase